MLLPIRLTVKEPNKDCSQLRAHREIHQKRAKRKRRRRKTTRIRRRLKKRPHSLKPERANLPSVATEAAPAASAEQEIVGLRRVSI